MASANNSRPGGEIRAISYYGCRRALTGTTPNVRLFGEFVAGAGEFSELDQAGRLPENKVGYLRSLLIEPSNVEDGPTTAQLAQNCLAQIELRTRSRVAILVQNVEICRGPVLAFCSPGFFYAANTSAAAEQGTINTISNGGHLLAVQEHQLTERASVTVTVQTLTALSIGFVAAQGFLYAALQVADSKLVMTT